MAHSIHEVLKAVWPDWEIVGKPLGTGSFSTVYRVERKDFVCDNFAALKVIVIPDEEELEDLKAQQLSGEEIQQTLKQHAADYAAEIRHMYSVRGEKNVVFIEDYKVYQVPDEFTWYILIRMELLTPLNAYLSGHMMREEEILRLGVELCTALAACREKNIVHRDIARKNIFVDENGVFKLGDFGVARTVDRSTRVSSAGTPTYMAPEVIKATMIRSNIDAAARADIYSLGMVLYELSNAGKPPFVESMNYSERYSALQRRIEGEALPPPKDVSPALQRIILKACAYEPEKRYQSAAEMKETLEKLQEKQRRGAAAGHHTESVQKNPGTQHVPVKKKLGNANPKRNIFYLVAVVLLVGIILGCIILSRPNTPKKEETNQASETFLISVETQSTVKLTEIPTEIPTEMLNEAPTEEPTDAPTEASTGHSSPAANEEPVEAEEILFIFDPEEASSEQEEEGEATEEDQEEPDQSADGKEKMEGAVGLERDDADYPEFYKDKQQIGMITVTDKDSANVRSIPGQKGSDIIGTLPSGAGRPCYDKKWVYEENKYWYHIWLKDDVFGWISQGVCKFIPLGEETDVKD